MVSCEAPGPDSVHGYCIKIFASRQEGIAFHLQSCIFRGEIPDWMTARRTVLILKDKSKETEVSNYRPITSLPLMWKLVTGIVVDEICNRQENDDLLPEEQKGGHRYSRGAKYQLLIDHAVLKSCSKRKVGLSMVWIHNRNGYDMVPHLWIKISMGICGVADNICHFLSKRMESWQTILMSENEELTKVNIQRRIF